LEHVRVVSDDELSARVDGAVGEDPLGSRRHIDKLRAAMDVRDDE
jgi:hypothetical protein